MATIPFTTRIDKALKNRLEEIAQYEDRSASYMANQAIRNLIEERDQTHELVRTGLKLVDKGVSISSDRVNEWLQEESNKPFPQADTFEKL